MKEKCSEKVWHASIHTFLPCTRDGVVQEDDKPWCKQHAPSAQAARDIAARVKWDAERAQRKCAKRIKDAEAKVVEAAVKWVEERMHSKANHPALERVVYTLLEARKAAETG